MYRDKTIQLMKDVYNESEERINIINMLTLTAAGWQALSRCTVVLFTYEAKALALMENCLNILRPLNYDCLAVNYLPQMKEQELIELYQFHNPMVGIHKEQSSGNHKIIPSMGWPMVRKRFEKPILACLIMGQSDHFAEMVLQKKGCSNPANCDRHQIRAMAPGLVHTIMHSSDDMYAVLCEAFLIFGKEPVISFLNNSQSIIREKSNNYKELIQDYSDFDEYSASDLEAILALLKRKVEWQVSLMSLNHQSDERLNALLLFLEGDRTAISFNLLVELLESYQFIFDICKREIVECIIY